MAIKKWKAFRSDYVLLICVAVCYGAFLVSPQVGVFDWLKELAYFEFIRDSLLHHQSFPFWWWNRPLGTPYPALNHTSLFIANPETFMFSPFIWICAFVETVWFIKLLTAIHLCIGIAGVYMLADRVGWNESQRRIFFIGFLLSPFLIQHLTIGYTPWLNIMFFPWLIYYWAKPSVVSWVYQGAIYAIILLQGGTHVCAWFFCFFLIWEFCIAIRERSPRHFLIQLGLIIPIFLLAAVRIIPTYQVFGSFRQAIEPGYSLTNFMEWSLLPPTVNQSVKNYAQVIQQVPTWDGAHFWWLIFPLFGLLTVRSLWDWKYDNAHSTLLLYYPETLAFTISALLLLSFDGVFSGIIGFVSEFIVNIEVIGSLEKYPYRWAIPAYFAAVLFVADYGKILSFDYLTSDLFQILLAAPLMWACLSWSSLAVSVNPQQYVLPKVKKKEAVVAQPKEALLLKESSFNPSGIRFKLTDKKVKEVVIGLPHVPKRDLAFVTVKGGGIPRHADGADHIEISTHAPERVRIEFHRDNLWIYPIRVTIASWITLLIFQVIARVTGAE
ncbi:MAG: hypothetical protein KDD62_10410 [Bdellovibrionales bacterium]|nr:hypothetical protein [Bdellovibrionales bacterium]